MTTPQILILAILAATIALFLWGRWRHDMVALAALMACLAAGLVPAQDAFTGFGHPAVITVACVLILSSALQTTGAVDSLARYVLPRQASASLTIAALAGLAALLSSFMNNVGALALLMPIALQMSRRLELPPGQILMPIAFGSLLGGMTTLIGTPPNLIVSGFRAETSGESFAMFDFTPVGLAVAVAGLAFLALASRHLVPVRERNGIEGFETGAYLTEAYVRDGSSAIGKTLLALETEVAESEAQIVGVVRNERRIPAPGPYFVIEGGDILVVEAAPKSLSQTLSVLGLELVEDVREETPGGGKQNALPEPDAATSNLQSDEISLVELAVRPSSDIVGHTARTLGLRSRFGVNLLAISRAGTRSTDRLRSTVLRDGDVLLVQGPPDMINEFAARYGLVPLAARDVRIPEPRKAVLASAIMLSAVGGAALGLLPAAISFAAGVLALVILDVVPVRRIYDAIDWSVIVLLAALLPVADAMTSTGTADLLARTLMDNVASGNVVVALTVVLVLTMTLSDFMNNAATAAVMCPIAVGVATQLGAKPDAFLMAVAIGASCAFLTPIGHQNNTLILGPGGFRFGDYWRLGLPLEILVVVVAVPLLLVVWPV